MRGILRQLCLIVLDQILWRCRFIEIWADGKIQKLDPRDHKFNGSGRCPRCGDRPTSPRRCPGLPLYPFDGGTFKR